MRVLWLALLDLCVEIVTREDIQPTAGEVNLVRAFLRDNGVTAKSLQQMQGALSRLAEAALRAPFSLEEK